MPFVHNQMLQFDIPIHYPQLVAVVDCKDELLKEPSAEFLIQAPEEVSKKSEALPGLWSADYRRAHHLQAQRTTPKRCN